MLMYDEHGCSGGVQHRDVRERPDSTLRFFIGFDLFLLLIIRVKVYVLKNFKCLRLFNVRV